MYKPEVGETVWALMWSDSGEDDESFNGEVIEITYEDPRYPSYVLKGKYENVLYDEDYDYEVCATEEFIYKTRKQMLQYLLDERNRELESLNRKIKWLKDEIEEE